MPCYTVTTVNVELGKVQANLIEQALKRLGFERITRSGNVLSLFGQNIYGTLDLTTGKLAMQNYGSKKEPTVDEIKRMYSVVVVETAAKKMGWNLQQKSPTKFVAQRRY